MYEDRLRSTSPHVRYMGMGQNYQDSQLGIHQCLDQCPNALPTGPTQMALPKNRGTLKNERLSITLNYISGTSPLKCPIPKNHDVTLNYRSLRFARNSGCLWFYPVHRPKAYTLTLLGGLGNHFLMGGFGFPIAKLRIFDTCAPSLAASRYEQYDARRGRQYLTRSSMCFQHEEIVVCLSFFGRAAISNTFPKEKTSIVMDLFRMMG